MDYLSPVLLLSNYQPEQMVIGHYGVSALWLAMSDAANICQSISSPTVNIMQQHPKESGMLSVVKNLRFYLKT